MSNVMKRFVLLECDAERAWKALTDPAELREWLAEKAEIELREGGALVLESVIPLIAGRHRIRTFAPTRALVIDWQIEGVSTLVTLRLEAHGALTRLLVSHDVGDDPRVLAAARDTMENELSEVDHAWGYALLMLKSLIETGTAKARLRPDEDPLKVDFTMPIAASPERVFAALTNPEEMKQWSFVGEKPIVEKRVGGRYSYGWECEEKGSDGPDEFVEYEEGRKITYSWHQGYYGDPKTLVSWSVEPADGGTGTRLRFQHSGFVRDPKRVLEYKLGWAHGLYALAAHVEKPGRRFKEWHGNGEGPVS